MKFQIPILIILIIILCVALWANYKLEKYNRCLEQSPKPYLTLKLSEEKTIEAAAANDQAIYQASLDAKKYDIPKIVIPKGEYWIGYFDVAPGIIVDCSYSIFKPVEIPSTTTPLIILGQSDIEISNVHFYGAQEDK